MYRAVFVMAAACVGHIAFLLWRTAWPIAELDAAPVDVQGMVWGIGLAISALLVMATSLTRGETLAWWQLLCIGTVMCGGTLAGLRNIDPHHPGQLLQFTVAGVVALLFGLGLAAAWGARWAAREKVVSGAARLDEETRRMVDGPQFDAMPMVDAALIDGPSESGWMEQAVSREVEQPLIAHSPQPLEKN